jgi:hypothetical protein
LSLLLFVLAMEVLNVLFRCADERALFMSLRHWLSSSCPCTQMILSCSLPHASRTCATARAIMEFFADASGLRTNVAKCQFVPIRCTEVQVAEVEHWFPCRVINFPFRYLGVPLSTHRLTKDHLMPLVDAVADRLPG